VVLHHQTSAGEPAEVDEHVRPFGGSEHQLVHRHRLIPHSALGADLPEARTADIEVQNACVAAVQDAEPVHARLDVEERPHLAVDEHDVSEVLADPGGSRDAARRIQEGPVWIELAVLDDKRDLVGAAGDADRVWLCAGVVLVADDVGGSEPREHVQPGGPESVVVEPEQRGWHLRQLVRVVNALRLAGAEAVRGHRRVAVARCCDEAAVQVGH
jgi:hypothetical protein